MDLIAINAFIAVGDRQGFRAAGAALGMTSAGVSKAVARLEAQLGATLVARTTRSVRLTPAGLAFHQRCKAIVAELDEAGREASAGVVLPQGRIVVSMTRTYGRLRVLPVIAAFVARYPAVEVEARASDRPAHLVADGVDLAIRIGHLPDSDLVATLVGRTGFVLAGSPGYLATHGTPARPEDLSAHTMVGHVAPGTATRFTYPFLIDGAERRLALPSRLTVDDGDLLAEAAARSAGLVMANDYVLAPYLADGQLVRLLGAFETAAVPIHALRPSGPRPPAAVRILTAMLRRNLGEPDQAACAATDG